jgi:dihydrofolate reductase
MQATAVPLRSSFQPRLTPGVRAHEDVVGVYDIEGLMRRIVMFNWITADGYFAGPSGDLDWVVADEEQAKMAANDISGFDTVLFGRRTYEIFEAFWGHVVVDDSGTVPDPHHPGRRSSEHGTIAIALNNMTKIVFSKTLGRLTWRNSRLLHELEPGEIETMKSQPGKDMIVFGSGSIVSQLTQHALIDEYKFVVCPILLGSGRQLLSDVSKRLRLNLLEAKGLRSGDVVLRYGRQNQP